MRWLLAASALVLLALAPAVLAHGPPDPKDKDVRLLQDWNDDCGGDNGAATGGCRGSIDLLGLDVQEAYDAALGEVAIFRLFADKGQAGPHKVVISLDTSGGSKTFTLQTSDDRTFTNGGGFDKVAPVQTLPGEATRFSVDGTVRLAALGRVGESITKFRVDSYAGSSVGDFMPGGCNNTVGSCIDTGQSGDQYIAGGGQGSYRLRGPIQYVSLEVPAATQTVGNGTETFVELHLANLLGDEAQRVSVTVQGAPGVTARFHNPADHAGSGHTEVGRVDLPKKSQSMMHLALTGTQAGASGTLTLTATTDLGGHVQREVRFQVVADAPTTSSCPAGHDAHGACPTKASPSAPLAALAALALAARARAARRS